MNPDKTIRVGDRVKVKTVPFGNAHIHVGRTGVVKRIDFRDLYSGVPYGTSRYRYGGLSASEVGVRYVVEMEGARPEQIFATRVEKIPEPVISVGDRVIIREGFNQGVNSSVVGRIGTVSRIDTSYGRTRYAVRTETGGADLAARVELVEDVPRYEAANAAVGDTVVIVRESGSVKTSVGRIGTVEKVDEPYKVGGEITGRKYHVRIPEAMTLVPASRVTKVAAEDFNPVKSGDTVRVLEGWTSGLGTGHAGKVGTVTDVEWRGGRLRYTVDIPGSGRTLFRKVEKVTFAPSDTPTLNPITMKISEHPDEFARRVRAAEEAHRIWGEDADLDRLIGTSEYLLGVRTVGVETTGTVQVGNVPAPSPSEDASVTASTLYVGGTSFRYDGTGGDVVETDDGYLKPEDARQLIEFLQAAQRRYARDVAPAETPF